MAKRKKIELTHAAIDLARHPEVLRDAPSGIGALRTQAAEEVMAHV